MTHDNYREQLSALLDGELDEAARADALAHLEGCAECQAYFAELTALHDALNDADEPAPPADFAAGVLARLHAEDMTFGSYFSHESADGRSAGDRLKAAGMTSWRTYGENIANAYWGAVESHAGWISSEGHRANLLKDGYTRFGAGFGCDGYAVNSVEDFYAEMGE